MSSNGLYASSLLEDQEPKVWEYVYLIGGSKRSGEADLYMDGFVIANNAREAIDRVIECVKQMCADFDAIGKVVSVRPFGYAVDVD